MAAKLEDIVGPYVAPPEHAVVLSVDEKSQIQALNRTQPGLPLNQARPGPSDHPEAERLEVWLLDEARVSQTGRVRGR